MKVSERMIDTGRDLVYGLISLFGSVFVVALVAGLATGNNSVGTFAGVSLVPFLVVVFIGEYYRRPPIVWLSAALAGFLISSVWNQGPQDFPMLGDFNGAAYAAGVTTGTMGIASLYFVSQISGLVLAALTRYREKKLAPQS